MDLGEKVPEALKCMEGEVLMPMDSGAVPNVANRHKHIPGSTVKESEAQKAGAAYRTATGQPFPNNGNVTMPPATQEGHNKTCTFQNADATLPRLSTGNTADCDSDSLYQQQGGKLIQLVTCAEGDFVRK